MTHTKLSQAGFTISELLVATAIGSAMTLLMFGLTVYLYGDQLQQSARAEMTLESQLFLRELVEDIRVAGEVRATNQIDDPSVAGSAGEWVTSDPANILIVTSPAIDSNSDFVIDPNTGFPYQNEIIYFGQGQNMYKRILTNPDAILDGAISQTTCPASTASAACPEDTKLSENLSNLLFVFYDIDDSVTTVIADTHAVELTVNLTRNIFGRGTDISNSVKSTMRNNQN